MFAMGLGAAVRGQNVPNMMVAIMGHGFRIHIHHPHVELTQFEIVGFRDCFDQVIWGGATKPQCQTIAVHNRGQVTLQMKHAVAIFSSMSIAGIRGHTYPSDLDRI